MIGVHERMEQWFVAQCNGAWEHEFGIRIESIDNPGWLLSIDLQGTQLEGLPFSELTNERSESDWVRCRVRKQKFEGFGAPKNLAELLTIFLDWAEMKS